jgi:subtilase family serine protease
LGNRARVGPLVREPRFNGHPSTGTSPLCGPQWHLAAGTSELSPLFAGVVTIAARAAGHQLGWLNATLCAHPGQNSSRASWTSFAAPNTYVFCSASCETASEVDTTVPGFDAKSGYDMSSGLGTIDAADFVFALARH